MGESNGIEFWNNKGGNEGIVTCQGFHRNDYYFDSGNQNIYETGFDESCDESGSKKIRLSPEFINLQKGDFDGSTQSRPLGLKLKKSQSLLDLVHERLSKGKQAADFSTHQNQQDRSRTKARIEDLGSQEKLKASNFPAIFIKIGSWQRICRHEGDLTAKLYYAKHKMVWEVLEGALKSKMEIQWSDITAIRALMPDNQQGILEVELNQPPLFFRETNPQPRRHTLWQPASDFTGGQAPISRKHIVAFPPGILDKHYEKLLQCDQRLFALSQKPFPSQECPFFDTTMYRISEFSLSFNGYGSGIYPYTNYTSTARDALLRSTPNSIVSVMNWPHIKERGRNYQFMTRDSKHFNRGLNFPKENVNTRGPSDYITSNETFTCQNYQSDAVVLNNIENHLLGDSHVACSCDDERTLPAKVESMMQSYFDPTDVNNLSNNNPMATEMNDNNQVMQNAAENYFILDRLHPQSRIEWLLPDNDPSIRMDTGFEKNNSFSFPPFMFSSSNTTLDSNQDSWS